MPTKLRKQDGTFIHADDIPVSDSSALLAVSAVTGNTPAGGTGATGGAYDTSGHRDELIATVAELKSKFNALLAALKA